MLRRRRRKQQQRKCGWSWCRRQHHLTTCFGALGGDARFGGIDSTDSGDGHVSGGDRHSKAGKGSITVAGGGCVGSSTSGDSGEGDGGAASDEKHPAAASQAQPSVRAGGILAGGGGSTFEWDLEPAQRLESAIACSFVRKAAGQAQAAQPPLQIA